MRHSTTVQRLRLKPLSSPSLPAVSNVVELHSGAPQQRFFPGRQAWQPGQRHWDLHAHCFKLLTRNLAKLVASENGEQTSAGVLGLRTPETVFDHGAFAAGVMQAYCSEVYNRPDVGVSMLFGSLVGLRHNIQDGRDAGIYGHKFAEDFEDLAVAHDYNFLNRMLNLSDFPDLERSEADDEKACRGLSKLGAAIVSKWPRFAKLCLRKETP